MSIINIDLQNNTLLYNNSIEQKPTNIYLIFLIINNFITLSIVQLEQPLIKGLLLFYSQG